MKGVQTITRSRIEFFIFFLKLLITRFVNEIPTFGHNQQQIVHFVIILLKFWTENKVTKIIKLAKNM
jgi:hypothetical protein